MVNYLCVSEPHTKLVLECSGTRFSHKGSPNDFLVSVSTSEYDGL